jgi:HNH endonuclease/AP2 domain
MSSHGIRYSPLRAEITAKMVRAVIDYDPNTGTFVWIANRGRKTCIGRRAGGINKGRHRIKVFDYLCEASNLAWLIIKGRWPTLEIDHKDGDALNNKFDNLRKATRPQNCRNGKMRKVNTSGFKGVTLIKKTGRWRARISPKPNRRVHLGVYDTREEAAAVFARAAERHYGEFARAA